jgi:hypothetical protein
VYDVLMRKE